MRKAATFAAAALVALASRRYAERRKAMSAVAPDLRSPKMLVTSIPMNTVMLPLVRLLMSLKSSPGPGMALTQHRVGDEATEVLVVTPTEPAAPRPAGAPSRGDRPGRWAMASRDP